MILFRSIRGVDTYASDEIQLRNNYYSQFDGLTYTFFIIFVIIPYLKTTF